MSNLKHLNEMDAEELRSLVREMSWSALNLAQELAFANDVLSEELRPAAYKSAERSAYGLSSRLTGQLLEDARRAKA